MEFASKIFIDGADPEEARQANKILKAHGHPGLQGATTNPTLIAKRYSLFVNPPAGEAGRNSSEKIDEKKALNFWKQTVIEMSKVTAGPISIQVVGDPAVLTAEDMLHQARDRITWIPNAVVKFPASSAGLAAAEIFCQEGPVNITLTFSQAQAAGVYAATKTHNYDVFVSPFVGRLDNRGENGMDVVANTIEMYKKFGDNHVKVLTASVRNVKHILYALWLKSDVITIPFKLLKEWLEGPSASSGQNSSILLPNSDFIYDVPGLTEIPYQELSLDLDWKEYDLTHDLTAIGFTKFWEDWKSLIS